MSRVRSVPFLAVGALLLLAIPASAQAPGITVVTCAGATSTIVAGINDAGRAVGFYFDMAGTPHGFISDGRRGCEPLPGLPEGYMPLNVNDSSHVVGIHIGPSGEQRGFLYRRGQVTDLWYPDPGTCQTMPIGINSRGQVVGFYALTGDGCGRDRPFMWEDGVYTPLPEPDLPGHNSVSATGLNPRGDVVGEVLVDPSQINYGYLWPRNGDPVTVFGFPIGSGVAKVTMPTAINPRGDAVGFFYETMDPDDPALEGVLFGPCRGFFRDRDGSMTELSVPAATYTCSLGLNGAGEISGIFTEDPSGTPFTALSWRGFIARKDALVKQP